MSKRDFQKSRCYRFGRAISKSRLVVEYDSIDDATGDLVRMHSKMIDLLGITDSRLTECPTILEPSKNRTRTSVYSPRRNAIVFAQGSFSERTLIHELCHALNKYIVEGKRRNIGASHGLNYMSIYIGALGIFLFNGDFDEVVRIAQANQCKFDRVKLDLIIEAYKQTLQEPTEAKEPTYTQLSLF